MSIIIDGQSLRNHINFLRRQTSLLNKKIENLSPASSVGSSGIMPGPSSQGANISIANLPVKDEDNMASNSDVHLVTQQSVKQFALPLAGGVMTGSLTVGVDDTGHDVKFFGATSGQYMLWDESDDKLIVTGEIEAGSLDISGDVDVDGTLETDALTINGTATGALALLDTVGTSQIDDDAVNYAKVQNVTANNVLLGNDDGAGSAIQELSKSDVLTLLNVADGAEANVATNLGKTTATDQITITSSTGTNVVIGEATDAIAGLMSTTHHDKLDGIATSANNYVHPTHDGDDIDIDTTALTGATVISDLDFNITTDTLGHVTDANGTVATRNLTLGNLGYTGDTDANNYSLPIATGSALGGIKVGSNLTIDSSTGVLNAGPIALTTVQTAANQAAQLALTVQEGDVVVRTDQNKSYIRNSGTAGDMTDFQELLTPTDAVLSVTTTDGTYINLTPNTATTGAINVTADLSAADGTADTTTRFLSKDNTWDVPAYTTETYTAHENISAASSVDNSGRTYIQDITLDSNGHVTGIASATETVTNTFRTVKVDTNGDGSANNTLEATEDLMLKKGSNITLAEAGGVVTISSTATGTVDGSGTANDVVMWSDSDTLTDAPIVISGNDATFAGTVKGTTYLVNHDSAAGIGASLGDINSAELGPGYLNLSRDDPNDAKQIVFEKNDTEHSYLQTTSSGLTIGGADVTFTNQIVLTQDQITTGINSNSAIVIAPSAVTFGTGKSSIFLGTDASADDYGISLVAARKDTGGSATPTFELRTHFNSANGSVALSIDNSQNSTFAGTIASGNITVTGGSGGNGQVDITRTSGASIRLQSQSALAKFGTTTDHGVQFMTDDTGRWNLQADGHLIPVVDSSYDIGSDGTRVRNLYADTLYGDGSNLTGVTGEWDGSHTGNASITGELTINNAANNNNLGINIKNDNNLYSGALTFWTEYSGTDTHAARIQAGTDGTDAALYLQVANTSKTLTSVLTLDHDLKATFAGDVTVDSEHLVLKSTSPEFYFHTEGNHPNFMIAAEENVSSTLEFSSVAASTSLSQTASDYTPILKLAHGGTATFSGVINANGGINVTGNIDTPELSINDYIKHNGDTNTYFGFPSADTYKVVTTGQDALTIDSNQGAKFEALVYIEDGTNPDGSGASSGVTSGGTLTVEGRRDGTANLLCLRARDNTGSTLALPADQGGLIRWQGFDGTDFSNMGAIAVNADGQAVGNGDSPSKMIFYTVPDSSDTPTTALTLDKSQNATFTGSATIETGISLESGVLVIKNATSDSNGLRIFQDSSDASKIYNNYNGTLQLGVGNTTAITIDSSENTTFAGKVGVGVSPTTLLHLNGTGDAIRVESTNAGAGGAQMDLLHFTASPADEDTHASINMGGYYTGTTSVYGSQILSKWTDVSERHSRLEFKTCDTTVSTALTLAHDNSATFVGEIRANSYLRLYTTDDQANNWYLYTHTDDSFRMNYNGSGGDEITMDTSGNITFAGNITASGTGDHSFIGNVGIGITTPTTHYEKVLHVHEPSGSANIHITNNTTGSAQGDGCDLIAYGSDFYIWNREAGNMFLGTNATTQATINSSGNWGIGTAPTTTKFKVEQAAASEWGAQILCTGANPYGLSIQTDANSSTTYSLAVYTAAEDFYIRNDGKVMLGTTTPGRMLSINGGTGNDGAIKLETTATASNFWSGVELKTPNAQSFIYMTADDTAGTIKFVPAGTVRAHINSTSFICSGDVVAFGSPSDVSLKENIKPIDNALDKVSKLKGVTFDWKKSDSILKIKEDIGFIAQDVKEVLPDLVRTNDDNKLSLRDKGIIPVLVEAIKELEARVKELENK